MSLNVTKGLVRESNHVASQFRMLDPVCITESLGVRIPQ